MCACCYRCSFTLGGKGGVETAMSYDLSHNLLLQIVGTKRVTLLPPSAHRRLHLYPYWHGSGQQAQQLRSASHAAFEQDHAAEEHHTAAHHAHVAHAVLWDYIEKHQKHEEHGDLHAHVGDHKDNIQLHADNFPNGTVVTLQQGAPTPAAVPKSPRRHHEHRVRRRRRAFCALDVFLGRGVALSERFHQVGERRLGTRRVEFRRRSRNGRGLGSVAFDSLRS